jgi:16S rRNA (cytosine967-C5)-methyltransferase
MDRLRTNLDRTGLAAELVTADARQWLPGRSFPAILLDAPCTATGTIRRHPDILHTRRPDQIRRLTELQDALLDAAARLLAPGGRLVYAVCSLQPEEGPARAAALRDRYPALEPDPVAPHELPGLEEVVTPSGEVRTLPSHLADLGGMDGFFIARFRRSPG